ncbi:MAG: flagellin [Selenomonadaceae bacterium]|nr:flagellin [Selenomonadaceae bacterium]
MAMVVKNNMSAVRTLNTLNSNTNALQKSLQKVSSGMKINSAQDDASGYAISERMRVRIRSLDQANQNSQNDSALMKTAEGAVGNTVEILRALKEKAINAANDSNTDEDRQTIQKEINQFIDQIDDNALVQFNGKYLVDGSKNNATISSKTILLNQSLEAGTDISSLLTELRNRAGDSLNIQSTDKYQVSWVQNGAIQSTSGDVGLKNLAAILNIKDVAAVQKTVGEGQINVPKANADTVVSTITPVTITPTHQTKAAASYTYSYAGNVTTSAMTVTGTTFVQSSAVGTQSWTANDNPVATTITITQVTLAAGSELGADKFNKSVYTPDKTAGLAVGAYNAGVDKQLSGLTISILD